MANSEPRCLIDLSIFLSSARVVLRPFRVWGHCVSLDGTVLTRLTLDHMPFAYFVNQRSRRDLYAELRHRIVSEISIRKKEVGRDAHSIPRVFRTRIP